MQHTGVMLCSLFVTNRDKLFNVYFLTIGISEESEKKLTEMCQSYGANFHVNNCTIDSIGDLPIGQWNAIMYLKLFIPEVLPVNIERCLFLDVDMVINADIDLLYSIDLEDKVLAAAEDVPDCIGYKSRLGLSFDNCYINSGVMVCELRRWRKMEQKYPIFDFTRSVVDIIQNEQDVIAMYFKNNIKLLPIKWNMTTFYFRRSPMIFDKYRPQLREAKLNPAIIHFACPIKPWFRDCNHPLGYLYLYYLCLTPWANAGRKLPIYEKLTPRQRFNKHIKNILNRIGILRYDGFLIR